MTNRYAIRLTKAAEKELYGLQLKQFRQIVRKIFSLQTEPRPQDCKELKLMTQLEMEVTKDGKVEIPSEVATAMGWQAGEKLTVQFRMGKFGSFLKLSVVLKPGSKVLLLKVARSPMN
jgi:bifunctional DNA-binding transcriptional regulator/antitoxin component of YhaV-PrlF toxin-antitoxin module